MARGIQARERLYSRDRRPLSVPENNYLDRVEQILLKADRLVAPYGKNRHAALTDTKVRACFEKLAAEQGISPDKVADAYFGKPEPGAQTGQTDLERLTEYGRLHATLKMKPRGFYSEEIMALVDTVNRSGYTLEDIAENALRCSWTTLNERVGHYRSEHGLPKFNAKSIQRKRILPNNQ
jgi:hypothetical protein